MFEALFHNISETEKNEAIAGIIEHATPRKDFFLMLTLSVSMASFGILLNSTVILVGSMLIAPLLYPLLSFALGVIIVDERLMGSSMITILKSIIFALLAAFVIGLLFTPYAGTTPPSLLILDTSLGLMYAVVAAIAGFAAAFAMTKPHLNESLPGVAISVALVPPLAQAGLALSFFDRTIFSNAFLLFSVNIIGIIFSAMIVFALLHFSVKKIVAEKVIEKEEKIVEKEAEPVEAK